MPKTIEELELELTEMRGELLAKQKELDTQVSQVAHSQSELAGVQAKLKSYEEKERAELIAVVHGIDPKYECKDLSIEHLNALVNGIKIAHASPIPTPPPATPAKASGKGKTELESFFNA